MERMARDVRGLSIGYGTTEIQRNTIAHEILKVAMSRDKSAIATAASSVPVSTPDGTFSAAFVAPSAPTKRALIVLQEIFGVTQKIRRYCDLFARERLCRHVPDLFWRLEPGVELSHSEADIQRALGFLDRFDEDRALDDVKTCSQLLRRKGFTQIAVVGFCLGGKLAPLSLAVVPARPPSRSMASDWSSGPRFCVRSPNPSRCITGRKISM